MTAEYLTLFSQYQILKTFLNIGSDYNTILLSRVVENLLPDSLSRLSLILDRWGEKLNPKERKHLKEERSRERKRKRGENFSVFDTDGRSSSSDTSEERDKEKDKEPDGEQDKKREKMTRLNWRVRKDYLMALFSFIDFISNGEKILISPITASMLLQVFFPLY
jgi:hypothetical protein